MTAPQDGGGAITNLLIVAAVGFSAPLILGLAPGLRLPAVVLEIVAGIAIGQELGLITAASSAALIAAGLLSVVFPVLGLSLLRRGKERPGGKGEPRPSPAMPVLSVEDRALCSGAPTAAFLNRSSMWRTLSATRRAGTL